jgi:hypothetical protein
LSCSSNGLQYSLKMLQASVMYVTALSDMFGRVHQDWSGADTGCEVIAIPWTGFPGCWTRLARMEREFLPPSAPSLSTGTAPQGCRRPATSWQEESSRRPNALTPLRPWDHSQRSKANSLWVSGLYLCHAGAGVPFRANRAGVSNRMSPGTGIEGHLPARRRRASGFWMFSIDPWSTATPALRNLLRIRQTVSRETPMARPSSSCVNPT